jgi:hypothetical protein
MRIASENSIAVPAIVEQTRNADCIAMEMAATNLEIAHGES